MIVATLSPVTLQSGTRQPLTHADPLPKDAKTLLFRIQQSAWPMANDLGAEFTVSYSADGRVFRQIDRQPVVDENFAELLTREYRYATDIPDVGKEGRFVQMELLTRKSLQIACTLEVI